MHRRWPGDPPDIAGLFPRTQNAREFVIQAEVSAKRNMNLKAFHKQLTWGYNHCMARAKKHPGLLIFCLLINNAESHVNNQYHAAYRAFLNEKSLTANSHIRMLPWCAKDFAALTGKMYFDTSRRNACISTPMCCSRRLSQSMSKRFSSLSRMTGCGWTHFIETRLICGCRARSNCLPMKAKGRESGKV